MLFNKVLDINKVLDMSIKEANIDIVTICKSWSEKILAYADGFAAVANSTIKENSCAN